MSSAAAPSLLRVEGAGRSFGSLVAVREVSLDVPKGQFCAVIGPNGAGKTTFFNLVSGLFAPSHGRIWFDGEDVTRLEPHRRVARGMARTFQITEIFPELSLRDNVRVAVESAEGLRKLTWLSRSLAASVDERVERLLEMGHLASHAGQLAGEVSHGDQRAVEILMSLALRPRLLLLDEPTAGMGDQETYDVTQLIRRVHREESLTTLLVEHDMRVVFHLADRIVVLAEGSVLATGTCDEIAANEAVQAAYLGEGA
jgi:branched-chain amino acid transport system ATP-binding protein